MREERRAYYFDSYTNAHQQKFIQKFNRTMQRDLTEKHLLYKFRGLQNEFHSIVTVNNVLQMGGDGEYVWNNI